MASSCGGAAAHHAARPGVRALGALADDHHVDELGRALRQRRRHARVEPDRPQVDVVVELEPQPQQQPALEHPARHGRVADRAEQDHVVRPDLLEHRVGERLPGAVPAPRAQVVVGRVEGDVRRRRPQHLQRLGRHLGADAVAADDGEPYG